ncbi:tetratricopeptide repeat protein [uncultured Desulfuromusa sp.]|uniref:tetratricopeptide repeat protein n=1 Tax=uncultured Desulfuromusa sp. TaxID=219183 RepID=UPI002AA65FE1|nr:tetratricopeptide repeat protein [uncultured Desulfuromusa sp.]
MIYRPSFFGLLVIGFFFSLTISPVLAVELNGSVTNVTGSAVTIKLEGNLLPQIDDPVAINESIPGLGSLPLEGEWKITRVTPEEIIAEPIGESSQPQAGQLVIIQSSQPSTATTLQTDVSETYQRGLNYLNGNQGVERNATKAFPLIHSAASQGHIPAQIKLAYMYSIGRGVAADKTESFMWSRKAAMQGDLVSQYNIAVDYYQGRGVAEDKTEATKWFRKAANKGHLKSQASMGRAYYKGYGVSQNYAEAASWYTKAAQRGDIFSQRRLGLMYDQGEGVPQSSATAYDWYKKAAAQDDILSQKQLGFMYWNGKGISKDKEKAFYWFRKAARQGEVGAQRLTAMCYRRGTGTTKDLDKAIYWYRKAAAQGDEDAKEELAALNTTPGHVPQNHVSSTEKPRANQVPAGAAQMIAQIQSTDGAQQQRGAKLLARSAFKTDPAVLSVLRDELLKGATLNPRDKHHVDAMAWLCKILGTSGDKSYQTTLKKVSSTTRSRKIKKYARKYAANLR